MILGNFNGERHVIVPHWQDSSFPVGPSDCPRLGPGPPGHLPAWQCVGPAGPARDASVSSELLVPAKRNRDHWHSASAGSNSLSIPRAGCASARRAASGDAVARPRVRRSCRGCNHHLAPRMHRHTLPIHLSCCALQAALAAALRVPSSRVRHRNPATAPLRSPRFNGPVRRFPRTRTGPSRLKASGAGQSDGSRAERASHGPTVPLQRASPTRTVPEDRHPATAPLAFNGPVRRFPTVRVAPLRF